MKKIIILFLCIYILFSMNKVKSKNIIIPKEAIRLRIIANSNSEYDQKIKMKLSIEIENKIQELLKDVNNIDEARKIIKNNLDEINKYVDLKLKGNNYYEKYTLIYGNNFFPEKNYNGVIYESGYYESIVITLGNGRGKNWWCVLFPPLCLMEAEEAEDIEYKSLIKEMLDKYF